MQESALDDLVLAVPAVLLAFSSFWNLLDTYLDILVLWTKKQVNLP